MTSMPQPSPTETVRVIVIEDNEDDRILLLRQLRSAQMSEFVKFIQDGREAIDYLSTHAATLGESLMVVFLDLRLPSINGIEVLKKLREISDVAHVPVIVMTSSNNPSDLEQCQQLKVSKWVEKPITFATFSKSIADIFHPPRQR